MSDFKGRTLPLWHPEETPPLRRPKNVPPVVNAGSEETSQLRRPRSSHPVLNNCTRDQNNIQNSNLDQSLSNALNTSLTIEEGILSTSKLSADAKEWFPPEYQDVSAINTPSVARHSVQHRLKKYKTPITEHKPEVSNIDFDLENFGETAQDLQRLQDIIARVTEDPGEYDEILGNFYQIVSPYFADVTFISSLANLLVEQALCLPNFRYSAARLCLYLEEECPLFRSTLYLLCQKKTKDFPCSHGLALFLAELYAQLHYENLYGTYLMECLRNLIQQRNVLMDNAVSPDNIKVVCQALKLTGNSLETFNHQAVADIFAQLEALKELLPDSVNNLVQHVVMLRKSNWGQTNANSSELQTLPLKNSNPVLPEDNRWVCSDPVFYGPDGKELTLEERRFLAENCGYPDFMEDDSDIEEWELNPEMDEEVQIAYRQFLQQKN